MNLFQLIKRYHLFLLLILLILLCFVNKRENFDNKHERYCVVVPVYPPHYKYVKELINSINDIDIYFVFTTQEEYKKFPTKWDNKIILDEHITNEQIKLLTDKRSLPSFKKLMSLKILHKKYDYITCIDAETKIVKSPDLEKVYNSKVVIGGITKTTSDIVKSSTSMIKNVSDKIIKTLSNDYKYFTWWSIMPVYKCNTVPDFLNKIGMDDLTTFINDIEYYFFENLAYNYYCILYQDFKKIIVPDIEHSLEGQPSQIVEKYIHYNIGWIALSTYKQNPDFYDKQDNIYMIYHLDR